MTQDDQPITNFDWAIYADATLAGLAVLIPLPLVDAVFESFFRRRMPATIARRRQRPLAPAALQAINSSGNEWSTLAYGCLLWPLRFLFELLLQLTRKLLYFMTIKRAVDALNYYWQRAFLLDYMLQQGHLDDTSQIDKALLALEATLAQSTVSPLRQLARQIIWGPVRLLHMLWRARQGQEDTTLDTTRSTMARVWGHFDNYLLGLTQRYATHYQAQQR
jgi:hypothetical protein